jgi:outer membrane protein
MGSFRTYRPALVALSILATVVPTAWGETLDEAWAVARTVNQRLEASRRSAEAAGMDFAAARSARLPQIQAFNLPTFLSNSVSTGTTGTGSGSGTSAAAGSGQRDFVISAVAASVPLYMGGKIRNTVAANRAQTSAARADEATTTLDLKLDVARAYVGVLRAMRALAVAQSNVSSLRAQVRDVANLVKQGRAIRNDLLAAQVAFANARQREIQVRNNLDVAWATYNRFLCRPLDTIVPLADLAAGLAAAAASAPDIDAIVAESDVPPASSAEVSPLIDQALHCRPELASLTEQARVYGAQARVERAATRPQATFVVANLYQNARFLPTQADSGAAAFLVNWTIFDGGKARRKALALERREESQLSQRADLSSQIALQVRSAWLTTKETQQRIPVTRAATTQAEENLRVARDRYLQQRGTNTEVLDAEYSRVQSYDNFYNALYDAILADLELHRAIGNL